MLNVYAIWTIIHDISMILDPPPLRLVHYGKKGNFGSFELARARMGCPYEFRIK